MNMYVLMVLFSTFAEPAPHPEAGFGPRVAETLEQCLQRRSFLDRHLADAVQESANTIPCVLRRVLGQRV